MKCEKLIRFKKVMKEVLELCQSLTKTSTSREREPHALVQKAVFQEIKYCIIPLYLHNPALLKAGEPPSDLEISMLSPSVSLLSFRKTGKCADM